MPRSTKQEDLTPVESWDDVPSFASEDEEDEFWTTHEFGEELMDSMTRGSVLGEFVEPISIVSAIRDGPERLSVELPAEVVDLMLEYRESQDFSRRLQAAVYMIVKDTLAESAIGPDEDFGWLDYLVWATTYSEQVRELYEWFGQETESLAAQLKRESEAITELRGNSEAARQTLLVAIRTAKLIDEHAIESYAKVHRLNYAVSHMAQGYRGLAKTTGPLAGPTEASWGDLKKELILLLGATETTSRSIKNYRVTLVEVGAIQRDLKKATRNLNQVLQNLLDTFGEVEVFASDTIADIDKYHPSLGE